MNTQDKYARIPDKIWDAINYVMQYASKSEDWLAVKKEILWMLPNKYRKYFGRRHQITRKNTLNDFDQLVIDYWHSETGKTLRIADNQRHDPEWVSVGRGHATREANKLRNIINEKEESVNT